MPPSFQPSSGVLPTMPERAVQRPGDDNNTRASEESERKRLLRDSYQSTNTIVPSITERPSEEVPERASATPSRTAITQWQAPNVMSVDEARIPPELRHPGPAAYARSTANDYTVYDGGINTPANGHLNNGLNPHNAMQIHQDSYFRQPYQRAGPASIRETLEENSIKGGRYTPLQSGQTPKKPASRQRWADGEDPPYEAGEQDTPPKRRVLTRRGTSVYIVREGDDDGSPPPGDFLRLPLMAWLKGPIRNHFVAVIGEFIGTTMFLFFAFAGTLVANIGAQESSTNSTTSSVAGFSPIVTLYVSIAFGFSLMCNVWIFFRVSGGLFNPAVTLAMVMTNTINYIRGALLFGAQIVGAIFASFLVQVLFPTEFNVRTTLSTTTSLAQGVFIEAILTAELVFTIFMLAKEKHKATYMAPIGIGVALFIAELVGVFFTGGSLNPARSFGPCVTTGQFDAEHWIYWVGPALGAIAAVAFYRFIKVLEYEMANPGQDHSAEEAEEAASVKSKRVKTLGDKEMA